MERLKHVCISIALLAMPIGVSAHKQTLFDFGWHFTREGKTVSVDLPHVTTWKGRAVIVVRSQRRAGGAKVSVSSSLPTESLSIRTR